MKDNNTFLIEGELAFQSYQPKKLKIGMHFLSKIMVGVIEPQSHFFTLEHIPEDEELFMSLYGAPIKLLVISGDGEEDVWAEGEEIGWFDACDSLEENVKLVPLNDKHINTILNDHDGIMDVSCDEDGDIIYFEGKIILSYLEMEEDTK